MWLSCLRISWYCTQTWHKWTKKSLLKTYFFITPSKLIVFVFFFATRKLKTWYFSIHTHIDVRQGCNFVDFEESQKKILFYSGKKSSKSRKSQPFSLRCVLVCWPDLNCLSLEIIMPHYNCHLSFISEYRDFKAIATLHFDQ